MKINVINPIWFYLCDVFNIVKTFATIAADTIEEAFDHVIDKLVELRDKEK